MSLTFEQIAEILEQYQKLNNAISMATDLGRTFPAQRIFFKTSDGQEINGFYNSVSKDYKDGFLSGGKVGLTNLPSGSGHGSLAVRNFDFSVIVDITPVDPKLLEDAKRINTQYEQDKKFALARQLRLAEVAMVNSVRKYLSVRKALEMDTTQHKLLQDNSAIDEVNAQLARLKRKY